ncbi:nuclear transport factor 2 family protein [Arthrobacter liuii]|uniref:SnoaL-like domain-containing protein n=1 Tax=Arthrobacter liuii TaxID=1476996 RepID=A0ABQ2B0Q7_9MICC|nr:nuclear transport factor 2 family protein [Arthrobacter liuii]GGI01054.1 hypothetical protein GCM10007170_39620 [Arthrobacter liuii]
MGQAREAMDRLMTAMDAKDREALAGCYAVDAVIRTPDQGGITGRDAIADYFFHFWEAMPDVRYEQTEKHEAGDVAVVEGFMAGTNTGPLALPTAHSAYFDQMELLGQLGLLRELSTH